MSPTRLVCFSNVFYWIHVAIISVVDFVSVTLTKIREIALIFHQISDYLHPDLNNFSAHVLTMRFKLHK